MPKLDLAFIQAASQGRLTDLQHALALGANPQALLPGGQSALHMACSNGYPHLLDLLLRVCDPFGIDYLGHNALHKAVAYAHPACTSLLLASPHAPYLLVMRDHLGRTPWLTACTRADLPSIELLSHASCHLDARDYQGDGALHLAAQDGAPAPIEFILDLALFDPNEPGSSGATAFMQACQHARIDAARLLAPLSSTLLQDPQGRDALCLLALHCHAPPDFSAPAWAQGIHDQRALHEADTAQFLLSLGLSPDGPQPANPLLDPLLISCINGHVHLSHVLFHASSMPGGLSQRTSYLSLAAREHLRDELANSIEAWGLALFELHSIFESTHCAPSIKTPHL
jgi:ankyrin repeat protein